jgi:hypothetical protein
VTHNVKGAPNHYDLSMLCATPAFFLTLFYADVGIKGNVGA